VSNFQYSNEPLGDEHEECRNRRSFRRFENQREEDDHVRQR
jgi:hypothetical protein